MEKSQKNLLLEKRVELVETLDMTGGLYTQLLARKVINQRKVNDMKLQGSPEAQAEELLNYLPKKDCFVAFCEALIADDQEHIVEKILKSPEAVSAPLPTVSDTGAAKSTLQASTSQKENLLSSSIEPATEDTDSANTLKRPCPSPPQAVVCIKEADEKYLLIQYSNSATPEKRQRVMVANENSTNEYEQDETRYAMKHFVADPVNNYNALIHPSKLSDDSNQFLIYQNSQSLFNSNISDQARYGAAFSRQQAEKPFENSSPSIPYTHMRMDSSVSSSFMSIPTNALSVNNENKATKGWQQLSVSDRQKVGSSQNVHVIGGEIGSLSPLNSPHKLVGSTSVSNSNELDPVKLLQQNGVLNPSKGINVVPPQFSLNASISQTATLMADSVDTIMSQNHATLLGDADSSIVRPAASPVKSFTLPTASPTVTYLPSKFTPKVPENDDLEIDLPDGCVNVQVEHSTKQFFVNNFKKSYPMRQIPRGLALVMNVDEVKGKPPRKGTNFDRDNLCNLLSQLHFNCVVYNDTDGLSAQEMVNKLKNFAKLKEHYNYDACFICLLSHGEEGYIFGTDGKRIPLEEIFMLFGNTSCKGLIGKPKVFIIQACRGGTLDKGVKMDEPDGGTVPTPSPTVQQLPSLSDMLICYPTQMGYYAWRNRARGSWYIEAIVQVFMRYAKSEDICAMLNRVNQVVSRKVSECNLKEMNQMSQMSEYKSTLRQPHLFLFPGIGCSSQ